MRLTCYSYLDRLILQTADGSPMTLPGFGRESAVADHGGFPAGVLPYSGARPAAPSAKVGFLSGDAPAEPEASVSPSASTSVEPAGWTEMVIQERTPVLFYVTTGHGAKVNASVNDVMVAAYSVDLKLRYPDAGWFDACTCGCSGWSEMTDNKISCLML